MSRLSRNESPPPAAFASSIVARQLTRPRRIPLLHLHLPPGWAAPRAASPYGSERSLPLPPDAPVEAVRAAWETERRAVWELKAQVSALEAVKEANEKDIRSLLADLAAAGRDPKTATPASAAANAAAQAAVEEAKAAKAAQEAADAKAALELKQGHSFDLSTASGRAAAAAQQLLKAGAQSGEVEHIKAELAASRAMARSRGARSNPLYPRAHSLSIPPCGGGHRPHTDGPHATAASDV